MVYNTNQVPVAEMGISLLKAVIFDLDGVIVKFNLDSRRIKEEIIVALEETGFPKGKLSSNQPFATMKEMIRQHLASEGKEELSQALIVQAEGIQIKREVEAADKTELLPGAKQALESLKVRGLKIALFTYNNRRAAEIALARHGLMNYFDLIISRDMVSKPKPNPAHLSAILEKLKVRKDEALVIGDSEMDIRPSKELGVKVVALTTGIRSKDELLPFSPDYMISNISKLRGIVERKMKAQGFP